ncbi:MAG: DUF255 domain-containing protein [Nanoarchaeota archaeon]
MNNLLGKEKSRYLLQHKDNPVNWYAWGEEAFEKARTENKPIFLSIGYSSCHWCHVMAHECFEDLEIAKVLNDSFVSIKLDKEEYPDIDGFYMDFLVRNFGSSGWPLNVFLNHNNIPFYGMTYLPKYNFLMLLNQVLEEFHKNTKIKTMSIGERFKLKKVDRGEAKKLLESVSFDNVYDVFGPRFPRALFLFYKLHKGLDIEQELENIITKGLFDHIEGGWFRYSVDSEWKVPHFEKMLYDQATLLFLCAEVYYKNQKRICKYAIEKTIFWLNERMRLLSGLYGSAADADTKDGEGYYYTIEKTNDEKIKTLFRLDECGVHENRFMPWINFAFYKENPDESNKIINLYKEARKNIDSPGLDNKSVMSWNCFFGFSLLRCADALGDDSIKNLALALFDNIFRYHVKDKIFHVVYDTEGFESQEYLEDYASYLLFLSEIVKIKPELKDKAEDFITIIEKKFVKEDYLVNTTGTFFDNPNLLYDMPLPSGGSILLYALLNLNHDKLEHFASLTSGVLELIKKDPSFFGLWLYCFEKLFGEH